MFRILWFCLFISLPLWGAPFPEDGSLALKGWIHSASRNHITGEIRYPGIGDIGRLREIARQEGFELISLEHESARWFQDHLFFSDQQELIRMARLKWEALEQYPPSMSTWYSIDDRDFYRPDWVKTVAETLGFPLYDLKATRVEGGEMISGIKDGKPYVLMRDVAVKRTQAHLEAATLEEAVEVIARDLKIDADQLLVISGEGLPVHIDTYMMALPNGRIIIRRGYSAIRDFLSERGFHVSEALFPELESEKVNFFNGVVGKSARDGALFVITNRSPEEKNHHTWEMFLKEQGVERVYFVGEWVPNAGIGCAGALF